MNIEQKATSSYHGKVIIVTGGGSGIGRVTAQRFAELGGFVLVVGRHADTLQQTIQGHPNMTSIVADLKHENEAVKVVERALELWGRIDVLVNNAAFAAFVPFETVTTEQLTNSFAVNLFAPIWLSRAALSALTESKGAIINVSSTYGHKAGTGMTSYGTSKAALEHWTRCLALEQAPKGIRVNAVAPGPTETEALERAGLAADAIKQIKRREITMIPVGRRGTPGEVAHWIVALADSSAAWITGQVFSVDGGMSIT